MGILDFFRPKSPIPYEDIQGRPNILDRLISLLPSKTYTFTNPNLAQATPTPTPTPTPEPRRLATENYTMDNGQPVPPPPDDLAELFWQVFPNDATRSAVVAYPESGYNPAARNDANANGSSDLGLMQNNSNTFNDLLRRRPGEMAAIGANQFEDVLDPLVSLLVASLTRKDEDWAGQDPWSQWYGWQDKGIDLSK